MRYHDCVILLSVALLYCFLPVIFIARYYLCSYYCPVLYLIASVAYYFVEIYIYCPVCLFTTLARVD